MNAKIGDKVIVIDDGKLYSSYDNAAKVMGLKLWKEYYNKINKSNIFLVLNDFMHHKSNRRLLGITDGLNDFVIGEEGVKVVESGNKLPSNIKEEDITSEQKYSLVYFDINNLSL